MDELINITENNGIQTVSARTLYKGLEISKRFSAWWESNSKDFTENEDFFRVYLKVQANRYGGEQELEDYSVSIDMAKAICLMSRTEIGKKYRSYLIELEKAWNTPEAVMARALQLANNTLEHYKDKVIEQQKQIETLTPKAEVHDRIANADGLKAVEEVAKNLGYGKNTFFSLLRGMDILYYASTPNGKINLPKQIYLDNGYFRTVEEPYTRGDKTLVYTKVYITGKGETWLAKKIAA